jgi:hypothetical protein
LEQKLFCHYMSHSWVLNIYGHSKLISNPNTQQKYFITRVTDNQSLHSTDNFSISNTVGSGKVIPEVVARTVRSIT